jgi:hypothetical protein
MIESKKSLTPEEILKVLHGALICGIAQHHLAGMHGVNEGRVAEVVVAGRWFLEHHKEIYRHVQKTKGNGRHKRPVEVVETVEEEPLKLLNSPVNGQW